MIRLANIASRRPKSVIVAWLVLLAALGFAGTRVERHLSPSILVVKGTESSRAQEIAQSRFGDSVLVPVMLVGPAKQLDRQGPALVSALRARSDARVLSPWDKTAGSEQLRPKPGVATIVTAVERSEKVVANTIEPQIERTVRLHVAAPVKSYVTGQPSIDRAMRHESISTTRTAVLITLPVLFVLCTLLFGSPVLAAAVTFFSGSVLAVGFGLTALTARVIDVDPVALAGAAVVGLALSSAFALMLISRYREEIGRAVGDPSRAPRRARALATTRAISGTGRSVLIAGTAVVITMIIATELSTTEILNSVGIGATIMAAVGALAAVAVLPALLTLGGHRIEQLSFLGIGDRVRRHLPSRVPSGIIKHPLFIGSASLALLLALAAPALNLKSGAPSPQLLPSSNSARQSYEAVAKEMGPGWVTPFEVVVAKREGTITTRKFLKELSAYQQKIATDPAVVSVVGPGQIAGNANDLQGVPKGLNTAAATAKKSKKDLKKLIAGLGQAGGGVAQLRSGLSTAANGAAQLNSGSGQAASGAAQLSTGLNQALAGAQQLKTGSASAASGARQLSAGLGTARKQVGAGLPQLHALVGALGPSVTQLSQLVTSATGVATNVDAASQALDAMTTGKSDPAYQRLAAALAQAKASSAGLANGLGSAMPGVATGYGGLQAVEKQVNDLYAGLVKLHNGATQLSAGNNQIAGGNAELASGLSQLAAGARQLESGLGQLHGGTGQLAGGLSSGVTQSAPLQAGMGEITKAVVHSRAMIPSTRDLEKLKQQSPRLFDSGYFVLAALEGAPTASRQAAGFTVNVERGGAAGRITVVPRWGVNDPRTQALGKRLSASVAAFARATGTQAAIGGNAASLIQYHDVAASKLPGVVIGISVFTLLLILVVTRSLVLPVLAVVLNLATAAASLGVLSLLFSGSNPPLGGPGQLDPVTLISVLTVVFGISQVYAVFVLGRARERYDSGDRAGAAFYGINRTWAAVTGLSIPMLAGALLFTPALVTNVRELAVGILVAVLLNAVVVRMFLLPAAMAELGRFNWWLPRPLGRLVPRIHFRGRGSGAPPVTTVPRKPN
jgi:putative drug exporter of the RND superfamily